MSKLRNVEGVVQAYDFVQDEETSSLVLEFMSGGELFERIVDRDRYSEVDARECAHSLLRIVRSLHHERVLHRDIKPENMLLTKPTEDIVKLADFGSALILADDNDPLPEAAGTEIYLAPEVLLTLYSTRAPAPTGLKSDMWSCGVVIYVLLAG